MQNSDTNSQLCDKENDIIMANLLLKPSSILKPQKEEADTTQDRPRRVSFAASNFVKSFIVDAQDNTVWDTTYEERINQTDSTGQSSDNSSGNSQKRSPTETLPLPIKKETFNNSTWDLDLTNKLRDPSTFETISIKYNVSNDIDVSALLPDDIRSPTNLIKNLKGEVGLSQDVIYASSEKVATKINELEKSNSDFNVDDLRFTSTVAIKPSDWKPKFEIYTSPNEDKCDGKSKTNQTILFDEQNNSLDFTVDSAKNLNGVEEVKLIENIISESPGKIADFFASQPNITPKNKRRQTIFCRTPDEPIVIKSENNCFEQASNDETNLFNETPPELNGDLFEESLGGEFEEPMDVDETRSDCEQVLATFEPINKRALMQNIAENTATLRYSRNNLKNRFERHKNDFEKWKSGRGEQIVAEIPERKFGVDELIQTKAKVSHNYWEFEKSDDSLYFFTVLCKLITLMVDCEPEQGTVKSIELLVEIEEQSDTFVRFIGKMMTERLQMDCLNTAIGKHFDVLMLLDYIVIVTEELFKINAEWDALLSDYPVIDLEMNPDYSVSFQVLHINSKTHWKIQIGVSIVNFVINDQQLRIESRTDGLKCCGRFINDLVKDIVKNHCSLRHFIKLVLSYHKRLIGKIIVPS